MRDRLRRWWDGVAALATGFLGGCLMVLGVAGAVVMLTLYGAFLGLIGACAYFAFHFFVRLVGL